MKKLVLSLAVALNLAASGIPVYDGAAFGQRQTEFFEQVKTWLEEADRWVRTTQHYKNQIDAYAKELATKTGIRDAVAFVEELKDIYAQAKSLKGSIQTQVALLEAEKTQIEIYQLTRQRQKDALKEQERELYLKGEAQPVGLSFRGK